MIAADDQCLVDGFGQRFDCAASVSAIEWIDDVAWYACGDGMVRRFQLGGEYRPLPVHGGAILCAAIDPTGGALLTGGDDGRLVRLSRDGDTEELGHFGRYWVEHVVAGSQSGIIVAGVGKEAVVWRKGSTMASHRYGFGSTVGGVALDAKGRRLAVSHYGAVALLYASSADSGRVELSWAGSHLGCTLSPDGAYVISAMQETGLHGWRLPQMSDLAMNGYRAKTRSFSWSRRGRWLATSGDLAAIVWPFQDKDGPLGKRPLLLGQAETIVSRVAFHPRHDILAIGYADGAVALVRIDDERVAAVESANGAAISALAWRSDGGMLAWGDENGRTGLLDMNSQSR